MHQLPTTEGPGARPAQAPLADLAFLGLLRKSGIYYDGGKGADDFFNRLEDLWSILGLLQGTALTWYHNHRDDWTSWEESLDIFRQEYLPHKQPAELLSQILQRSGEPDRAYIT